MAHLSVDFETETVGCLTFSNLVGTNAKSYSRIYVDVDISSNFETKIKKILKKVCQF